MKRISAVLISLLIASTVQAAEERPSTKAEIEKIAVGKTVNGWLKYMKNGRYTFEGRNPGRYTISKGKICIRFDNGASRCDRIVTNGKTYTMITARGERYAYGK